MIQHTCLVVAKLDTNLNGNRDEEEHDDYRYPLTLKSSKANNTNAGNDGSSISSNNYNDVLTPSDSSINTVSISVPTVATPVPEHMKANGV